MRARAYPRSRRLSWVCAPRLRWGAATPTRARKDDRLAEPEGRRKNDTGVDRAPRFIGDAHAAPPARARERSSACQFARAFERLPVKPIVPGTTISRSPARLRGCGRASRYASAPLPQARSARDPILVGPRSAWQWAWRGRRTPPGLRPRAI